MKRSDITTLFPDATEEQVKALMDINGADINNAKKGFDEIRKTLTDTQAALTEAQKSNKSKELEAALEKMGGLQTELDNMKAAESIRITREKVSQATGVPANLLTMETEEDCTAQAQSILNFAQPQSYPSVKDGGEVNISNKQSTRDQFANWFNEIQ